MHQDEQPDEQRLHGSKTAQEAKRVRVPCGNAWNNAGVQPDPANVEYHFADEEERMGQGTCHHRQHPFHPVAVRQRVRPHVEDFFLLAP